MKKKHTVHFDEFDHVEYRGWAWSPSDSTSSPRSDLIISCGHTTLGRKRRTVARPDVDLYVKDESGDKGFALPIVPFVFLGQILGNIESLVPVIHLDDRKLPASELPARFRDISVFRTLVLAEDAGPFKIADLWLASSHQLRLRLDPTPRTSSIGPITLRFYQPRLSGPEGATLELVHEQVADKINLTIATVPLANPFLPLLIVALAADDDLIACDLLPYPSLCRGGLHSAELAASGLAGSNLAELRILSDSLAREFAGWSGSPPRSIGKIAIDALGASGAEPIFGANIVDWLTGVFGIELDLTSGERLKLHPLADTVFARHLETRLKANGAPPPRADNRPLQLTIPSRAVPTISALASRRLADHAGSAPIAAPFLISESGTARPKWLVSLPPTEAWINDLQPATAAAAYPTLSNPDGQPGQANPQSPAIPVAVLLHEAPSEGSELRLFPVPQDYQDALLRGGSANVDLDSQTVSIVVTIRERDRRFEVFLESAAGQTIAERTEIVVVNNRSLKHRDGPIRAALERTFPDAHKVLEYDETFNHSAQINLGASHAGGRFILVANSSVVFHDPRTLEILLHLANAPNVATASCMLLHRPVGGGEIAFRSAGYFPGAVSFLAGPHIHLVEADCEEALSCATYPVAANSLDLTMVRADTWAALGGLDERNFPFSHNDIDFAMRASEKNFLHLCTTAVSAYCDRRRTRGTLTDVPANAILRTAALADIIGKAAVLRKL